MVKPATIAPLTFGLGHVAVCSLASGFVNVHEDLILRGLFTTAAIACNARTIADVGARCKLSRVENHLKVHAVAILGYLAANLITRLARVFIRASNAGNSQIGDREDRNHSYAQQYLPLVAIIAISSVAARFIKFKSS